VTLPAPGAPLARLRFASAGCQRYEDGHFTAFRHLAAEPGLDFVAHYGDYFYEYRPRAAGELARPTVRTHDQDEVYTLVDYRNRYGLYKSDPDLIAAHLAAPFLMSWDDHEVDNNWAGDSDQDGTPPELFVLRRAAAFQAYYENMPLRRSSMPRTLTTMPIYRRFAFGDLAEVNVLDTRQYRTDQPCDDKLGPHCEGALDPAATILGADQQRWLFDGLAASKARWNVLAQQVAVMQMDRGGEPGAPQYSPDKWDGYLASRRALLDHLARARVANPVVLTGDIHNNWAGELKADFADPASATVGVEFVATSITSGGDGSDAREETPKVLAANPHIRFFNDQRGYVTHEVTPEGWTAHYRVVDRVTVPDAPVRTRASFAVPAGKPGIERA
jgi:alkaline phosphatase D